MAPSRGGADLGTTRWVIGFVCGGEWRRGAFVVASNPGQSLCALCGMPLARAAVPLSLLLCCKDLGHMLSLDLLWWARQLLPRDLLERQHRDAFTRFSAGPRFHNLPKHPLQLLPLF